MKRKLLFSGISTLFIAGTILGSSLALTSCSNEKVNPFDKQVSDLVSQYRSALDSAISDPNYGMYTDKEVPEIQKVCSDYLTKANDMKKNNINDLSIDGQIWLDSLIDEIQVKQQLVSSNIHYLLTDQWDDLIFTNYQGILNSYISDGINNFLSKNDQTSIDNLNVFDGLLTKIETNLKAGLSKGITMSAVMVKHAIGSLLQSCFTNVLDYYAQHKSTAITLSVLQSNGLFPCTKLINDQKRTGKDLVAKCLSVDQHLFKVLNYICNTYYPSIKYGWYKNTATSGGAGTTTPTTSHKYTLTVTTSKPNEEDNGYSYNKNTFISGLGLSTTDLNTKDIGIGFMNDSGGYGKKIYQALLRKHSNTTKTPKQIYDLGNNAVASIVAAMKQDAQAVASCFVGTGKSWSPKGEYYDQDSSGNTYAATLADSKLVNIVSADGTVNLPEYFIWLNTNRWFNGRDMRDDQFPTLDGKKVLKSHYSANDNKVPNQALLNKWDQNAQSEIKQPYTYFSVFKHVNKGISNVKISNVIGDPNNLKNSPTVVDGDAGNLAYKYLEQGLSPSTIETSSTLTNSTQTKSISSEAAFVGTSHSIRQYLMYKDTAAVKFAGLFKRTSYDYTLRTGIGGAAYANSGAGSWKYSNHGTGGFYLDSNPYFGLQKWSTSTLASHESICGHVFQFNYAHDHPAVSYAPSFNSNAYAEGWGLFSEWLAVQIGMYGEPTTNYSSVATGNKLSLPKFGVNSNNINVTQFKNKDDFANGAYWVDDTDLSTPEKTPGNSQKLYDAVQYFGFLNERQLRAMRCAVDVGLHAGTTGTYATGTGMSLNEARNYMKSNSGLGIDDINRETKRYLEYTGQATSYFNGLMVIQDLFLNAASKYENNNTGSKFIDYSNTSKTTRNTSDLFDLILRNGDVPIDVLNNYVTKFIGNNFNKA